MAENATMITIEKLLDPSKKIDPPIEDLAGKAVYSRRGSQFEFGATKDNKIQVRKIWTGAHKKQEAFLHEAQEIAQVKSALEKELAENQYKLTETA